LKETAESAGECGDHGDGVELHEDVEDLSACGERIIDLRGHREQLARGPEHGAAERVNLGLVSVTLEQKRCDRAEQVDSNSRDENRDDSVP
jgi:hypothetical protein